MAVIDDLKTARDNVASQLASITANPKPTYSIDGETVQWSAYLRTLTHVLEELDRKIAAKENTFRQTQGFT